MFQVTYFIRSYVSTVFNTHETDSQELSNVIGGLLVS